MAMSALRRPAIGACDTPVRMQASASAPASVGNVGVGFDLLGHTIEGPCDIATVRRIDAPQVRIVAVRGRDVDTIPLDPARNTAGLGLMSLRAALGLAHGFELELDKGIALGSGLGGSAASCVAALVAANALLEAPLSRRALYLHALEGESASSGSRHGDNVGPMLIGGMALTTAERLIPLHTPDFLHCVVVHPDQSLETRHARAVLGARYGLREMIEHTAHLALFLTGLARDDVELIRAGLRDVLVEPRRAPLIPGFASVQAAALDHHGLGASISGAGPSVFAWFASRQQAQAAAAPMRQAFVDAGFDARAWISPVRGPRAEVLSS